jgi:hypothetical protein
LRLRLPYRGASRSVMRIYYSTRSFCLFVPFVRSFVRSIRYTESNNKFDSFYRQFSVRRSVRYSDNFDGRVLPNITGL